MGEAREGFPTNVIIPIDRRDFPPLELRQAAHLLAEEPDLGRVLTPEGARDREDIGKHPPIRGSRAPNTRREQGDLVLRGPLRQGIGAGGGEQRNRRRPPRPLGFQALVARHPALDVEDGFTLFPDHGHAVDAAIALVEEGDIVDETIGQRDPKRLQGAFAHAEHGEKLCAHRCYCRYVH